MVVFPTFRRRDLLVNPVVGRSRPAHDPAVLASFVPRRRPQRRDLVPPLLAGTLATAALALGWRGGDWPGQLLRIDLVLRDGPGIWSNQWFAGHFTAGYSILFPIVAAVLGPGLVAVVSCVVAAAAFHVLATSSGAPAERVVPASVLFAVGTVANVAVGRLTFAFGMAVGLVALALLQRGCVVAGCVLTVLTAMASPVAGALLALVLAAVALDRRRVGPAVLGAAAVLPIGVIALLFPQSGTFPFRTPALVASLVVAGVVALVTTVRVVRIAAALDAAVSIGLFLVDNPLGANATRLTMFFAVPTVVLTARRLRSPIAAAAVVAALWWQWSPALDGIVRAGSDPSSSASFYEPLVDAIRAQPDPAGRVEVVPTQRHWETFYVARELPLARGWERQLDMSRNPAFYDGSLDAATFHHWLRDHAVRYVALADAGLDPGGVGEAELVRGGLAYLTPVWHDDQWQLFRVVDPLAIVDGPARLVDLGVSEVTLDVFGPGPVLVRVTWSSHWSLDHEGCVRPAPDGWTIVEPRRPGRVTIRAVLARSLPIVGALDDCSG